MSRKAQIKKNLKRPSSASRSGGLANSRPASKGGPWNKAPKKKGMRYL